jgi:NDP-sugar pyrophosphorylase family protein
MTAQIRHAVILAAGRGHRMMPLTESVPKAMALYDGMTLIARGIDAVRRHVPFVHITVGYKRAMLAEHVIHHGVSSVLNTDGHSNSWWLYNSLLAQLDEPIFVLTCDNVTDLDFDRLEEDYFACDEPACMLVPVRPVPGLAGDFIFHNDHIVTRLSRTDPADIYCSGIQVVNPVKVQQLTLERGDFADVWAQLIPQSQVRLSRVYPDTWFSVDTVAQLEARGGIPRPS